MNARTKPQANTKRARREPRRRGVAVGLALAALAAGGAAAAPPTSRPYTDYAFGTSPGARISLHDALTTAIQHDPAIWQAQQTTLAQKGSVQQSAGLFDLAGIVQPSAELSTTYLSFNQRKGLEQLRDLRRQIANESDRVADGLQQQLSQGNNLPPDCASMSSVLNDVVVTTQIGSQTICIQARQRLELQIWENLAKNFGLTQLGQALDDAMRARTEFIMDLLHGLAFAMRKQMRELGTVPVTDTVTTLSLNLGLRKAYRNGAVVSPALVIDAINDNFDDKPINSNYGGKGRPDSVTTSIGLELDVPLGKGRGAVSADAPERSARFQYQASLESQGFAVASSALATEIAYWNLVGAQDTLDILQRSQQTEEKLLELGKALVEGDEIAPAELAYLQARVASTRGSVAQARQAVLQARINLANAMGVALARLDEAPLASDPFPPLPDVAAVDALSAGQIADAAYVNRGDLASSRRLLESANVLAAAARADLKRQFDLTFIAGYSGLYEGGIVTKPHDYWYATRQALSDFRAGPSAVLTLNVTWPFANNVAKGRYAQARASALESEIQAEDLKRVISANTTRFVGSLRRAARLINEAQSAADYYGQSLAAETEKFKVGESTAIDILLTEDSQLSQLLSLVSARQSFSTLLAQLRFESGTLVSTKVEDDRVVLEGLRPGSLEFPKRTAN